MQPAGVHIVWLLRADYTGRMVEQVVESELDAREAEQRHSCPKSSCTPTAGIFSGTSCATPVRLIRRRRWIATSRLGRSQAQQPG